MPKKKRMEVKRTEKGWPGHFIASASCLFRRHTMLEFGEIAIGISTVGNYKPSYTGAKEIETIGHMRYFETMAFHCEEATEKNPWRDPNIGRQISFESEWAIGEPWKEQEANDMHEAVVNEIAARLLAGDQFND